MEHAQTLAAPLRPRSAAFVSRSERVEHARARYMQANLGWWAARRSCDVCGMAAFARDRADAWCTLVNLEALETL